MIVFVVVIILTIMLMWISYFLGQKHLFMAICTIKAIWFFSLLPAAQQRRRRDKEGEGKGSKNIP